MKGKKLFLIICIIFTFVLSCFGVACGKNNKQPEEPVNLSLKLSDEKINLFVGIDYQLIVDLKNNGVSVSNAKLEWTTENSNVATVNNGKIVAIAVGQTTIGVKAEAFNESITANVAVNVVDTECLVLSENRINLFSKENLLGETFENAITITAEIVKEDGNIAPASIVWSSEDDSIATVENGVIQGQGVGETKIWASATDDSGKTFKAYVKVNVDYPVVEKDSILLIDKSIGAIEGITFTEGGSQIVEKVLDVQAKKWMSVENGKVNTEQLISGEREYIVCNDTYGYRITETIIADQIIKTSSEMELFLKNATGSNTRDKYYVLGADLDYRGVPFNDTASFTGTFNGMGHALYNVGTFEQFGEWTSLFGSIAGTIKNLALVDVEMPKGTDGVLTDVLYEGAVIDNVFIHVKSAHTTDQSGAISRKVAGNATIKNSLVWWEGTSYHRYCGLLFGFGEDTANVTFENTYVIAEPQSFGNIGGQRDTFGYQAFRAAMLEKNTEIIYTFDEFTTQKPMNISQLSRYWDVASCSIPTLESIMRTLSVESLVGIYDIEGESKNIGTAIKASEIQGKVNASNETTNEEGFVAVGSFEFEIDRNLAITQLYFGNERIIDFTYNEEVGKLIIPVEAFANVGGKNLPVLIRGADSEILIYDVNVIDYVFGTADKLSNFLLTMTAENTQGKMFALGSDIDFTGKQIADRGSIFAGDFDGLGYSIYNVTGSSGQFTGLFGTIAGGSVSNLSLVNGTITGAGGLFADVVQDGAMVDNVFIHVLSDSGTGNHGAIARWALGSCNVTNTIIWFDSRTTNASAAGGIFGFGNNASVVDLTGTYVIMDESWLNRNIVGQRADSSYVNFRNKMNKMNATVVKTMYGFATMQKDDNYGDIWDKASYNIYTMKGATNYMSSSSIAKLTGELLPDAIPEEPTPSVFSQEAFAIMAKPSTYADSQHGTITSVTATSDTVTISSKEGTDKGWYGGLTLTESAIRELVSLGYTTMSFTIESDSPYVCMWSFVAQSAYFINAEEGKWIGDDIYFANGSTVNLDLKEMTKFIKNGVGLKLAFTAKDEWISYESSTDLKITFSNFLFTKEVKESVSGEFSQEAFEVMASESTYAGHDYGKPTSVTATENTVTVSTTAGTTAGWYGGFTLTEEAVRSLVKLGYSKMQFSFTSDSPYICFWSFDTHTDFVVNISDAVKVSSGDMYFANGSTIILDLEKMTTFIRNGIGFKLVFTATNDWIGYESSEAVKITFSNFSFEKAK